MAFTSSDLDAIETAIASGQLSVQYKDRSVTYRSIDDLRKARDLIKQELGTRSSFEDRGRYVEYDRGLDS